MSDNHHKDCIEEKQLLLYLKGQLSERDIRKVELHLTDCELCSDALEGLRLLKNSDRADEIVTGLKHDINQKLLKKQKSLPVVQQWWQIAAVFIVLFTGIGGYLYIKHFNSAPTTVSENSAPLDASEHRSQLEITSDEKMQAAKQQQITKEMHDSPENNLSTAKEDLLKNVNKELQTPVADAPENEHDLASDDKKSAKDENVITDNTSANPATTTAPAPALPADVMVTRESTGSAYKISQSKSDLSSKDIIKQGMKEIDAKQYQNALNTFSRLTSHPDKDFYEGLTYFNIGNSDASLQHFDNVINYGKSDLFEDALWYKANIEIKKGNTAEAKSLLSNVIDLKGRRKGEASALLKTL